MPLSLSSWLTKHKLKYLNNKFSELIMKPYNIFNSIIKMITKHRIFSFSLYKQVKSRYKLYHVFSHFLMSLPERFNKNGGVWHLFWVIMVIFYEIFYILLVSKRLLNWSLTNSQSKQHQFVPFTPSRLVL